MVELFKRRLNTTIFHKHLQQCGRLIVLHNQAVVRVLSTVKRNGEVREKKNNEFKQQSLISPLTRRKIGRRNTDPTHYIVGLQKDHRLGNAP
jgi:hypothetical protein